MRPPYSRPCPSVCVSVCVCVCHSPIWRSTRCLSLRPALRSTLASMRRAPHRFRRRGVGCGMRVLTDEQQKDVKLAHISSSHAPAGSHCEKEPCVLASERSTEGRLNAYGECRPSVCGGQRQLKATVETDHQLRRKAHGISGGRRLPRAMSHG